ncbi:MAG: Ig-like domain-containing protein [Woeseiaceae bacterium]
MKHFSHSVSARNSSGFLFLFVMLLFGLALSLPASAQEVFINEIHYDNTGGDSGEAIEVAGPAGTDLAGWTLLLYNGNNSAVYNTIGLTGTIPNEQSGCGVLSFSQAGIQNGSPDGVALADAGGDLIQFLSYEGSFTGVGGPADGVMSADIGVSEPFSTPVGNSLQISGTGSESADFTWQTAGPNTFGAINTGQTFTSCTSSESAPAVVSTSPTDGSGGVALDSNIEITFTEGVNLTGSWLDLSCSLSGAHTGVVSGGPQAYTFNPDSDFVSSETCSATITATEVTDVDADDPPDNMAADVMFTFSTMVDSPMVINEVDADTAGSDSLEFVELFDGGAGNTPLDGLVVVFYNGSDNQSYNSAFDLDGYTTDADGFFVLGNAAVSPAPAIVFGGNGLQNGADAVALHVGNGVDFPNDTPVTGIALIDALVYDTNDGDDDGLLDVLTPGQPQQNEDDNDDKDFHSNSRIPDGGSQFDTGSYVQQTPTPGASNVTNAEIFEIQGAGLDSPLEDAFVASNDNIVTALDTNGFFMQTPAVRSDADPNTSEGVFVFTGAAPAVAVGDQVDVVAQVDEFFGMTELTDLRLLNIDSSGNVVPDAIIFDATTPSSTPSAIPDLERFEAMLVSFEGIATGPTNRFGETAVVVGTDRAYREPGIESPGLAGLPIWDGNPEIFEVDPNGLGGADAELFVGQTISAEGPLFFTFGDYQILPTSFEIGPVPDLPVGVRVRNFGEFTVGSLNMFRFFDNVNDPSDTNFLGQTRNDTVDSNYLSRKAKFAAYILDVLDAPDILAVQEVEKIEVLMALAADITAADPTVVYAAYLLEGNDVGTIDVGFMVRDTVQVNSVSQIDPMDTFFNPVSMVDNVLHDRPPLLLEGRVIADGLPGQPVRVIAVHNRSLSRIDDDVEGVRVRLKRLLQAESIANKAQELQTSSSTQLVIVGDFNAFEFSDGYVDAVGHVQGNFVAADELVCATEVCVDLVEPDLTNQMLNIPAADRYSFNFGGSSQALDHALTSTETDSFVRGFEFARGNADTPNNLVNEDTTVLRSSDHDGLVLYLAKDSDQDGVLDEVDYCPDTVIPEGAPTKSLGKNRFALTDGDFIFDTNAPNGNGPGRSYSTTDTAGCSCEQIIDAQGLGNGHSKFGCSIGVMDGWISFVKP